MKRFLGRSSRHFQLLVIVTVERIETVSIVRNHAQQPNRFGSRNIFRSQDIGEQTDSLFQFLQLLDLRLTVDGIAFYKVLFQDLVRPDTELCAALRFNTVANRDNYVEIISRNFTLHGAMSFLLNYQVFLDSCLTFEFAFFEQIVYMKTYILFGRVK